MTDATPLAPEQITQEEAISVLRDLLVIAGTPITERQEAVFKRARAVVAAGAAPARGTLIPVTDAKGFITLHEPDEDGKPGDLVASVWRDDWLAALSASPAPSGQGVSGEVATLIRHATEAAEQAEKHGNTAGVWLFAKQWRAVAASLAAPVPSCAPGEVERLRDQLANEAKDWRHNAYTRVMLSQMHDRLAALSPQGLDAKEGGE